eukprot:16001716-Heterocapsa_arctica.AAC.1
MKNSISRHKVRMNLESPKQRKVNIMSIMHNISKLTRYWLRKMMNKHPNNKQRGGILETKRTKSSLECPVR